MMSTNAKRMKPWVHWTLGTVLGLLFCVLCGIGYLYYQVKSISLEDIKERHPSGAMVQTVDSVEKKVPKVLEESVGKASEFANKPVATQDALDVAAILKDEKERARILKEAKEKQADAAKPAAGSDQTVAKPTEPAAKPNTTQPEPSMKTLTEEQQAMKEQIQKTYNSRLGALQADCVARSNALLSGLVNDIKQKQANREKVSMDLLQNSYLPKMAASENHCDQEFASMLASAKKEYKVAGLNPAELDVWQSQYNAAKEQARSKALSQLSVLLSAN